jgi:hypothetical protein
MMLSNTPHQQHGGIAMIMFIIIFIGLLATMAVQLVPIYLENQSIMRAVNQVKSQPDFPQRNFYKKLSQALYVNDVRDFDSQKAIKIVPNKQTGEKELIIRYEKEAPFFKNIFFVVKFENISPAKPNLE